MNRQAIRKLSLLSSVVDATKPAGTPTISWGPNTTRDRRWSTADGDIVMMRVHIELQRVQTWLFAVPRLRAMVGANVLLGEMLRVRLPELARRQLSWRLTPASGSYPSAAPDDPLSVHDDPVADAGDGILSRDGGHFEAMFETGARDFAMKAAALLRRELPGLKFRISMDDDETDGASSADLSTSLPVLAPCEWTGRGLASVGIRQGAERAVVSLDVSRRHEAARRAENGSSRDLASLLVAKTHLKGMSRARDFDGLAGRGYLALIHADGNGVGSAMGSEDVARATFFHRNRVLLRRAVQAATDAACGDTPVGPLLPLMIGGDDLLVLSQADVALPFVVNLCRTLDEMQSKTNSTFRLTLGVGVVFARPTIPIHRLHDVAEQLAASAKRRFRAFSEAEHCSVVDWAVYTTAWLDDPEEVRRRDWVRGTGDDARVLSQRPVNVLGDGLDSLQGLLRAAVPLEGAPRSQLRYLVEQLPKGWALSELAFAELSTEARCALDKAGVQGVWTNPANGPRLTSLLDLVEILEIQRLGRAGTVADEPTIVEEEWDAET